MGNRIETLSHEEMVVKCKREGKRRENGEREGRKEGRKLEWSVVTAKTDSASGFQCACCGALLMVV